VFIVIGLAIAGWWWYTHRGARRSVQNAKSDRNFSIEEAAPPPPPLSELRKLSHPGSYDSYDSYDPHKGFETPRGGGIGERTRPNLGIQTSQDALRAAALKRAASTMTRTSVSGGLMSPALASSVMEYAPYGAPARVLQNPGSGFSNAPRSGRGRASRASRIRSIVYGPSTAATEQSIAELQEQMPIPARPVQSEMTQTTVYGRSLPPPPPPSASAMPIKEDKPMRVVRASDLPPVPPLPTAAADLLGSAQTLPSLPGPSDVVFTPLTPAPRGRRLPMTPPEPVAGSSSAAGSSSMRGGY
jgi:hypothetical protein